MNIQVIQIIDYLQKNKYFSSIKDIKDFSQSIYDTFARRCDVMNELRKASFWLECNPTKLKKNYKRYLCNWFLSATSKKGW
jgi:acyl carrier protein phosphodiesterase